MSKQMDQATERAAEAQEAVAPAWIEMPFHGGDDETVDSVTGQVQRINTAAECNGIEFREVTRVYKVTPSEDLGNRAIAANDDDGDGGTDVDESHVHGATGWDEELLTETFAPLTFEEALRAALDAYAYQVGGGGQVFLDGLGAARVGMEVHVYLKHREAQAKKENKLQMFDKIA